MKGVELTLNPDCKPERFFVLKLQVPKDFGRKTLMYDEWTEKNRKL